MSDDVTQSPIAGPRPPLRPWQYAAIAVVGCGAALGLPALFNHLHQSAKPVIPASVVTQNTGQPWVAPAVPAAKPVPAAFSVPPVRVAPPPPMPAAAPPPLPPATGAAASSPLEFARLSRHDETAARAVGGSTATAADGPAKGDELAARLQPTRLDAVSATRMKHPALTIPQGTIIPCIDVSAMDSSYPGFITAVIPQDIRGATGRVILLDKGSTVFGTMQRGIVNGLSREFVLWQKIRGPAPDFVQVSVNSPAADELGRTGLDGDVNDHFWRKLKGALLLSTVSSGMQMLSLGASSALSGRNGGGGASFYQFQNSGDQAASGLTRSMIDIPDTLTRNQGASCSIFVSRDLDFSSVYTLRHVTEAP